MRRADVSRAAAERGFLAAPRSGYQEPSRVTDANGTVLSTVELDPGWRYHRSSNAAFQPRSIRVISAMANGSDEAMYRRYNAGKRA